MRKKPTCPLDPTHPVEYSIYTHTPRRFKHFCKVCRVQTCGYRCVDSPTISCS